MIDPSGGAPAPPEGCFRIACWSCRGNISGKACHLAMLQPDIAVIPEAGARSATAISFEWAPSSTAIERHAERLRGPVVVAGDFNTAAALDRPRGKRAHLDVVDALGELGLASAWHHVAGCEHGDEARGTFHMYGHSTSAPIHLDYCFVPRAWLPRVRTAWIGPADPWLSRSDHLPLVVDLELARERLPGGHP